MPYHTFIEWLCHDRQMETDAGARAVRRDLLHGARQVEPPAFSHPCHVQYLVGKSCFIMQQHPDQLDTTAEHIGYHLEQDDHKTAVIALRRQSARGA